MAETAIIPFNFDGDTLDVARLPDGDVGVSVRRLCEAIGLDSRAQQQRLTRAAGTGARWAVACTVHATGADGKTYQMTVLPRRSIPMWAATVDARKARPEVRAKLVRYQDAAADALAAAFLSPPVATPAPLSAVEGRLDKLLDAMSGLVATVGALLARPAPSRRAPLPPPASLPLPFEAGPVTSLPFGGVAALPAPAVLIPTDWLSADAISAVLTDRTRQRVTSRSVNAAIRALPAIRRDPNRARARPKVDRDAYGNERSFPQWFYAPTVVDMVHRHLAGLTPDAGAVASP